ncbi:hypothetical protein [Cytobacillus firmus]|uniref:hypothetical protein n=1 Tax=Cytobacillus firmus TaxID=1399 RepID=UPI0030018560
MFKKIFGLSVGVLSFAIFCGVNSEIQVEASSQCFSENEILKTQTSKSGEEYYEVSIGTANCLQLEKMGKLGKLEKSAEQHKEVIENDDTLLEIFQSEATGTRGEVRALNAKEAKIARKEEGLPNKVTTVKIIKDKNIASENQKHPGNENLEKYSLQVKNRGTGTITPFGTDTSGWDLVGTEYWLINMSWQTDTVWHSHGGDYSVVIPPHYQSEHAFGEVRLYDHDSDFNNDEFIGAKRFYPSNSVSKRYTWSGLSSYIDGDNKLVETYTKHYTNYFLPGDSRLYNVKYYD